MLTPDQIEAVRLRAGQLMDPVVEFLISDIAERIAEAGQLTSTAAYQVWRAQQLGLSQKQLKKELRKRLKVSQKELEKLMTQAAEVGYDYDISRFPHLDAVPFAENETLQKIVSAAIEQAEGDFTNLTQTMGFVTHDGVATELTEAYQKSCDYAFEKVITGAQDYQSAIRDATKGLAEKGILTLDYESGVHTSLEAAVRRNMMGGLGLMQEQISQQNHDDLGCDGWEISAHAASAPDHEPIQGKQYPDAAYIRLNNSLKRRIGTLNCGHSVMPIIFGINEPQYTDEELEQFRRDNEQGFEYDGKHYTQYEATQRQRGLERSIRKKKRQILIDGKLGDKDQLPIDQTRYVVLQDEYRRFSKAAGLRTQQERMNVPGFGPKQDRVAEKGYEKRVAEVGEAAATQNWHAISVSGGQTETKYRMLKKAEVGNVDAANKIIDNNVKNTNPAYKNGGPAYRQNCQRCVAAYEMRRRGYDVVAKPAVVGNDGKLSAKDPLYSSWKNVFEGARFEFHSGYDGGKAGIVSQMDRWGDGAVAEVRVLWNASEAHVFVAQRVNGIVRFIDPQTGNLNCEEYFTKAALGATMIARIDNLEPSALIEKCIKNRGGK